jgi:hypothetical protein
MHKGAKECSFMHNTSVAVLCVYSFMVAFPI